LSGQPEQNNIVQLVHSIIESYENNPRYNHNANNNNNNNNNINNNND